MKAVFDFLELACEDPRISTAHISLYAALCKLWVERDFEKPLYFFSHELMPVCKISSHSTYHKTIRDLHSYGYIRYEPSFSHSVGSQVHILELIRD